MYLNPSRESRERVTKVFTGTAETMGASMKYYATLCFENFVVIIVDR